MGNAPGQPIPVAIQELLRDNGLKVKHSTINRFLTAIEAHAPWFPVSGRLTLASWDKLGRDLDLAFDQGDLPGGVRPL